MEDPNERLLRALVSEERQAERLASLVRFGFLALLTVIAALNFGSISWQASAMNFGVLAVGYSYSLAVVLYMRRSGYRPAVKYITSLMDVVLVFLLLGLYASIEIPSVALKNYVFLVLFPIIALTSFRFDPALTLTTGLTAIGLYVLLTVLLVASGSVVLAHGGYDRELFSPNVTIIGQATKVILLTVFVALVAYQCRYTRRVVTTLVQHELALRQAKEALDWEMRLASQVQQHLLPRDPPSISGLAYAGSVRQGHAIGGDYYDFVRVPTGELLMVIADVSGKGAPAALIMAQVRAAIHLLSAEFRSLEDLVQRLNALIHRSTDRKTFVTLLAVEIAPRERMLRYVCAGHLPPILVAQGRARTLDRGSLPLGVTADLSGLRTHSVPFTPGNLVVVCTDGVMEHTDPAGEQFGDDRMAQFVEEHSSLGAQAMVDRLSDTLHRFGGGRDPDDDATVAVVQFTDPERPS